MSDVWVRVFDEENDAAAYAEHMDAQGYMTAVSDSSSVVKVRYSEAGTPKALNIAGDGSNFVVMAFNKT
jgi:hypothetical protein